MDPCTQESGVSSAVRPAATKPFLQRMEAPLPPIPGREQRRSFNSQREASNFHRIVYSPRYSRLDRTNPHKTEGSFRGFFALFWLMVGIVLLNLFYLKFKSTGHIISLTLAALFSRDAKILIASDATLILSTFLCVPYIKLLHMSRLTSRYVSLIQYTWELAVLVIVIAWVQYRQWPWVQSGFFVLHTLSMLMKIHSYMSTNSFLSDAYLHLRRTEARLNERILALGKVSDIHEAWRQQLNFTTLEKERATFLLPPDESDNRDKIQLWSSYDVQQGTNEERLKLHAQRDSNSLPRSRSPLPEHIRLSQEFNSEKETLPPEHELRDPHPLMWHSDEGISKLATDIARTREILLPPPVPDGKLTPMWPHNVTYANFFDYLLAPTLVYELQYPRTKSISPHYLLERTFATFGTFFVLYVIITSVIIPISESDRTIFEQFLHLMLPMMLCYLLIFYIIFECVCNGFAEITRFADREFYEDWWNSVSMSEFSRKWNRPVHHFLVQHVYIPSILSLGLSKKTAMFCTFFISSIFHELVMIIVTGKVRGYLFLMQMSQIPLIMLAKLPVIRENADLGNFIFWLGLMIGFPMLNIAYLVY